LRIFCKHNKTRKEESSYIKQVPKNRIAAIACLPCGFVRILRLEVYKKARWNDLPPANEELIQRFREASRENKNIATLFDAIMALEEPPDYEEIWCPFWGLGVYRMRT
jgi:hypothetical protein